MKQSVPVASSVTPAASATPVSSVTPVVTVASVEPVAPLPLLVPTMSAAEVAQVSSVTVSPVPISEVAVQPVSMGIGLAGFSLSGSSSGLPAFLPRTSIFIYMQQAKLVSSSAAIHQRRDSSIRSISTRNDTQLE